MDVDLTGRVVSHQNRRKARRHARFRDEIRDFLSDFRPQRLRKFLAVE